MSILSDSDRIEIKSIFKRRGLGNCHRDVESNSQTAGGCHLDRLGAIQSEGPAAPNIYTAHWVIVGTGLFNVETSFGGIPIRGIVFLTSSPRPLNIKGRGAQCPKQARKKFENNACPT